MPTFDSLHSRAVRLFQGATGGGGITPSPSPENDVKNTMKKIFGESCL